MCLCGFPASFFVAEFLISFYLCVREVARLAGMQLKSSWGDAFRPPPRVLHDLPHPAAGLPGCTEASPGEAAGTRSSHLAAAGGLCRGGVSYAIRVQRAEVKGWRESSCPARGSRAEMHAASGRGWGPGVSQLLHNLS